MSDFGINMITHDDTTGPAFLPSEHDELPHGVAFMVSRMTVARKYCLLTASSHYKDIQLLSLHSTSQNRMAPWSLRH